MIIFCLGTAKRSLIFQSLAWHISGPVFFHNSPSESILLVTSGLVYLQHMMSWDVELNFCISHAVISDDKILIEG